LRRGSKTHFAVLLVFDNLRFNDPRVIQRQRTRSNRRDAGEGNTSILDDSFCHIPVAYATDRRANTKRNQTSQGASSLGSDDLSQELLLQGTLQRGVDVLRLANPEGLRPSLNRSATAPGNLGSQSGNH